MEKNKNIIKWVVYGLFGIGAIALVYYLFFYSKLNFTSDGAAIVLLAKEQLAKGQFFPDGFCYSTGLFVVSPALIIAPLMKICGNWMLCRTIAMLVFVIWLFIMIFIFYKKIGIEKKGSYAPYVAVMLMCLPLFHYQETYYNAGYIAVLLAELMIFVCLFNLISNGIDLKKTIFYGVGLLTSVFIFSIASMHYFAIILIPAIGTIVLYAFIEYCKKREVIFKEKKMVIALGILILGSGVAYLVHSYLMELFAVKGANEEVSFVTTIQDSLVQFPKILLSFYNAIYNCKLFSLRGILNCVNFAVFVITTFVVPVLSIVLYKKITNRFLKIYIIYTWISDFIVIYMILFTTAIKAGTRYYETVFFHKALLTALLVEYLLKYKIQIIRWITVCALTVVVALNHLVYVQANEVARHEYNQKNGYSIINFLQDNDLTYGCATFWNAYKNMVLSNGEITIVGILNGNNTPFYWLTSRDWYNTQNYSGRSFYLLSKGQEAERRFYEEAIEVKYFQEYTILIFEENVLNLPHQKESATMGKISTEKLLVGDNAYYHSNIISLKKDGMQYGPYIKLESGAYELVITGEQLEGLDTSICIKEGTHEMEHNVVRVSDKEIVLTFELEEDTEGIEVKNINNADLTAEITGMEWRRINVER